MSRQADTVVVVEPYRSGSHLADIALARGFRCIGIESDYKIPEFIKDISELGKLDRLILNADLEGALPTLDPRSIAAVLAGAETGVELCERLASQWGLPANDPRTTHLRRNKFHMLEAVKAAGLTAPTQARVSDVETGLRWVSAHQEALRWPVVVKPLSSGGTDGLHFCQNAKEVAMALRHHLGHPSLYGPINQEMLIQGFLPGTEYVVNTLSWDGEHRLADVWQYHKRFVPGAGTIYDWQEILPIEGEVQHQLFGYVCKVLDAVGITHGPGHCEVMLTPQGPVLVELGARVQGGVNPDFLHACLGANQLGMTVDLLCARGDWSKVQMPSSRLLKHGIWFNGIANRDGKGRNVEELESKIRSLRSFFSVKLLVEEGEPVTRTVDLATCPSVVFLMHADPEIIQEDYNALRVFEQEHFV
jgi:biotin carboxylase